jgi:hypothetical protein
MPFIFKQSSPSSAGVIIFKHSEMGFLNSPIYKSLWTKLKANHLVGVYFGWHTELRHDIPFADFYLSSPETLQAPQNSTVHRIYLNGFNFIPSYFCPDARYPKIWDFITIVNNTKHKRIDQYLLEISRLIDMRPETTALLINPVDFEAEGNPGFYNDFAKDYSQHFPGEKKKQLTVLRLKREATITPLLPEQLVHFLRLSKIFVLLSEGEGAARVVPEALLTGLPVILKSSLKGGTGYYLDPSNSRKIGPTEDIAMVLKDAINHYDQFSLDQKALRKIFGEQESTERFHQEILQLMSARSLKVTGDFDLGNLKLKIPCHAKILPRKYCSAYGDDIVYNRLFAMFVRDYYGIILPFGSQLLLYLTDLKVFIRLSLIKHLPLNVTKSLINMRNKVFPKN